MINLPQSEKKRKKNTIERDVTLPSPSPPFLAHQSSLLVVLFIFVIYFTKWLLFINRQRYHYIKKLFSANKNSVPIFLVVVSYELFYFEKI